MTVIVDIAYAKGGLNILLEITVSPKYPNIQERQKVREGFVCFADISLWSLHLNALHSGICMRAEVCAHLFICLPRNSIASLLFSCFILFLFPLSVSLQSRLNCQSRKNEQWDWIWLRTYSVTVSSWGCSMHYLAQSLKWNFFHAVSMLRVHEAGLKILVPLRYCQKRQWAWPWSCVWRSKADTYNAHFCWTSLLQWNFN